jgi:hypothetical protein
MFAYGCNGFQVCFRGVLEACSKCFSCLQTYVATVVYGYFKSRSGVASLLLPPSVASRGWEQGRAWWRGARRLCSPVCVGAMDVISVLIQFLREGAGGCVTEPHSDTGLGPDIWALCLPYTETGFC